MGQTSNTWQQDWTAKTAHIDQKIIDCCTNNTLNADETFEKIRGLLVPLLEQSGGKGNFEAGKPAYDELRTKVQERITALEASGKITAPAPMAAKTASAGAAPAAKYGGPNK